MTDQLIVQGFAAMELIKSSEIVASAYAWALRDKDIQGVLIESHSGHPYNPQEEKQCPSKLSERFLMA